MVEVDRVLDRADRGRMRRVEHVEALDAEGPTEHLGREARAPHAEQDDRIEPLVGDGVGEGLELGDTLAHATRLVEPAEPLRLVGARPERRVALPDPVDQLCAFVHAVASSPRFARTPSSSSSNESANFCTPSSSSVSVTSS
jgi:hypothetical protein